MSDRKWPECELAGGRLGAGHTRDCRVHGWALIVKRETCQQCPVPALIAAREAAQEFLDSPQARAAFMLQGVHGGCVPWRKDGKLVSEFIAEALAAVERLKEAK